MMPSGTALTPPSVLLSCKSGCAFTGVVSNAVLSLVSGSGMPLPMVAVLVIVVTPDATGLVTGNVNVIEPLALSASEPTFFVHRLPGLLFGEQLQPAPVLV